MRNDLRLLPDFITPQVALALIPAFTSAYALATEAADTIDFLGWELRSQIMPNLKNWAVEFELKRRADEGSIPFRCHIALNNRKNHRHIELRNSNWIITVSQVHCPTSVPREAVFRNDYCLDGQTALEDFEAVDEEFLNKEIYAILTHGWQTRSPEFINCGIPSPDGKCWVQQLDVFGVVRHMAFVDDSPATDDIKLEFREKSIERGLEEQA